MKATKKGYHRILSKLIDAGAMVLAEDDTGLTAFLWACKNGRVAAARTLRDEDEKKY